ncbi:aminoglycoside phosphotransferase family protein [Neobacillus mesonae]|nr:aminoglycoside phosphotransferase family protein [Neobacillus mesonae]
MSYSFKADETENIMNRFGQDFYAAVLRYIDVYSDKWSLSSFQFIPSYSANLVFKCQSDCFGSAILKIGNPAHKESLSEFNTLKQYNGRPFCKVYDADMEHGIILEECIEPGLTLRNEASLEKRLSVFCSLFKDLHTAPEKIDIHPSYTGWVNRITEYMSTRHDCREIYLHMKKAQDINATVSAVYSKKMLLHGDFHHDNILLGSHSEYAIIDPKGVIGDPVFDTPRFILNEFDDEITPGLYKKINDIILFFEKNLDIPSDILRKCLYIETAMGISWSVEDGASSEEIPKLVETVAFAESILNS